jgi:hypothetical protein
LEAETVLLMHRPAGVTWIAVIFFLVGAYLSILAIVMLASPGAVSMAAGADLLGGLELAGPYMFLLVGAVAAGIGYGMLRLNNWARRVAILAVFVGVIMLIPTVSGAVVSLRAVPLVLGGSGVILRVLILWYLYQEPVKESFLG